MVANSNLTTGKLEKILNEVSKVVREEGIKRDAKLEKIARILHDGVPYYDWVGFYLLTPNEELILGPFVGEETDHDRIPVGKGVCGRAGAEQQTVVVQNVAEESNYLACSDAVRSEIVVPIFVEEEMIGEIDIDSHTISPFSEKDSNFLYQVACKLASLFSQIEED